MKQLAFILILSFFTSCFFLCRDTEFTFSREENNSNKLHLAGYYYEYLSTEELTERERLDVFVLNENGILYFLSGLEKEEILSGNIKIGIPLSKPWWGIYRIYGDSIEIQYWFPQSNSCVDVEIYKGIILNDTTYRLTSTTAIHRDHFIREGFISINKTFRFHQYSPKPDSVISFIP